MKRLGVSAGVYRVNMVKIENEVCDYFGVRPDDLKGASRRKTLVNARILFSARARREAGASLREIGAYLGGRAGSTIVHYIKEFRDRGGEKNMLDN